MKKKIVVMVCSLLLAMPVLGFAKDKKESHPSVSAYEHANENAKFKRSGDVFNNKTNKKIRAKRRVEKEAKKEKKKVQEVEDKQGKEQTGEGQAGEEQVGEKQVEMKF